MSTVISARYGVCNSFFTKSFSGLFPFCLLACEQALLFWRAKRASRESASEGQRKGELATIAHKFSFPARKPRYSVKRQTVTANVPQIREVRTACQGVTVSKQCFWWLKIYFFFLRGHRTSTCPLGWKFNTLILQSSSKMLGRLPIFTFFVLVPRPPPLDQCWTKLKWFLCVIVVTCPNIE